MTEPTKTPRAPRRARKYARQAERARKLAASLERAGKPDTAAMLRNLADLGEQRAAMLHPELYGPPAVAGDELDPDIDPECAAAAARVRAAFASGRTDSASPSAQAAPDAVTPAADRSEPTPSAVTPSGRSCAHCGRALGSWRRDDARYCSGACRVAAHRGRKGTLVLFEREDGRR